MNLLKRFRKSVEFAAPAPDRPVWLVGDLHGCADAMERLLAVIEPDFSAMGTDLVFLGDYVDRGPDAAGVLARVQALTARGATALMGNHERMLLDSLETPERADRWLSHGGLETLASFGVTPGFGRGGSAAAMATFAQALPPGLTNWLTALPLHWQSGTLAAAHAGADPRAPLEGQSEKALLWGRSPFLSTPRRDGLWLAHGHWIQDSPSWSEGRIGLDTGAYQGGKLTAALIQPDGTIHFEQA